MNSKNIPLDRKGNRLITTDKIHLRSASTDALQEDLSGYQHRQFMQGEFWKNIPGYKEISTETFFDHSWQARNVVRKPETLTEILQNKVPEVFYRDFIRGLEQSPMSVRVTPYILSLINWEDPYHDPLLKQFIPLSTRLLPDHPQLKLDSLGEKNDSPVYGLTHRYQDKALFLALDSCPVYCRYCTRSYSVGLDTEKTKKISFPAKNQRWQDVFQYISKHRELEDIVVSGGDAYQLKARQMKQIGETLLGIDHVRRIRFATKGPVVLPQKILTDHEWFDALCTIVESGRKNYKEVCLHTHFNHPNEITDISRQALNKLYTAGINVRNQSVLLRGVNDDADTMKILVKKLSYCNVQPYYTYVHDMVSGVEDLRTSVQTGIDLEKQIRGITAGYNTPTFVVDTPQGGGKRDIHSFEYYDRETGISVYTAPSVKPGYFLYFDPVDLIPAKNGERWQHRREQSRMIKSAIKRAQNG